MSLSRVLLIALVLRWAVPVAASLWGAWPPQTREPDSHQYVELARALVERGEFALDAGPEISRTPGYSLALAPGAWLDSLNWPRAWPQVWNARVDVYAIALQAFAGTLSVWLVARIATIAFDDPAAGRRAAWWMALEPLSVLYCGKLLSETLFTTCLLAGLLGLLKAHATIREPRAAKRLAAWLILAAAGFAAAMFVRPIAYYWPAGAAVWLACATWSRGARRRAIVAAAFLGAASLAPAVAWQVRNLQVADYGGFSAIVDENLLFWQAAGVVAEREGLALEDVQQRLGYSREWVFLARHPELADAARGEIYRAKRRDGLAILREAPFVAARQHLEGVWSTLGDPGTNAWLHYFAPPAVDRPPEFEASLLARVARAVRERPAATAVHATLWIALVAYWLAAALGFYRSRSWRRPACWLLVLAGLYLALASGGPNAYHRMRLPIVPLLAVWAGAVSAGMGGGAPRNSRSAAKTI